MTCADQADRKPRFIQSSRDARRCAWLLGASSALGLIGWTGRVGADPTVAIHSPAMGSRHGNSLAVQALVTSTYALKGVRAQVDSAGSDLTTASGGWSGTLNLTPVAHGVRTLTVTATDLNDATGSASIPIVVDRPPSIAVAAPFDERVVRPSIPVEITCLDDDPAGCASMRATFREIAVTGQSNISTTITPTLGDGVSGDLDITVTDSAGQTATAKRRLYVENSTELTEIMRVPGKVLSFTATEVLYLNDAKNAVVIRNRSTLTDVVVVDALTAPPMQAEFYNSTVVYMKADRTIYHWKGPGNTVPLGTAKPITCGGPPYPYGFKLAGPYAVFLSVVDAKGSSRPVRHHLDTGAVLMLKGDAGYDATIPGAPSNSCWFDLAPNGDVVYNPEVPRAAFWYRESGGQYLQLVHPVTSGRADYTEPLTNGESVVFGFRATDCVQPNPCVNAPHGILLFTPSGDFTELTKGGFLGNDTFVRAGQHFQFGGSWVGFVRSATQLQVPALPWLRSPAGVETQCSTLAEGSGIQAVSANGEMMFYGYRASAASPSPQRIYGGGGKVIHRDGNFHVLLGDVLFVAKPAPQSDGGAPEGGTPDASVPDATPDADAMDDSQSMDTGSTDDAPIDISTGGSGGAGGGGAAGATGSGGAPTGGSAGSGGAAAGSAGAAGAAGVAAGSAGAAGAAGSTSVADAATRDGISTTDVSTDGTGTSGEPPPSSCECGIGQRTQMPTLGLLLAAGLAIARRRRGARDHEKPNLL